MPSSDYRPAIDDIGARMYARTLDANGKRYGTFSATTIPNASAVDALIDDALATIESAVGANLDGEYLNAAKTCVIWCTCMMVELSYFPESTESGDSAYKAYQERYEDSLKHLKEMINADRPGQKQIVTLQQRSTMRWGGGRLDPFLNDLWPSP